jgi:hypothetical protein
VSGEWLGFACNPKHIAIMVRLAVMRKSFPAEWTYFDNHSKRHPVFAS